MNKHIGFIGLGNMGKAILRGILTNNDSIPASLFSIYDVNTAAMDELKQSYSDIHVFTSIKDIAQKADILILAVKPNTVHHILHDIQKEIKQTTIIVSIAAGITINAIETIIGDEHKIVRVMPNTPALINAGMSSITANNQISTEELSTVISLFDYVGLTEVLPEEQMHAATGVGGSAPAFVFMFIEALADGAVKGGMSRNQAYKFAAQTVMGSAKLVLETGEHPGKLKDMVCSPSGTTIEGVQTLEKNGFRSAVIDAVEASINRSKALAKE